MMTAGVIERGRRASARQITVLDDMTGWTQGALAAPPAPPAPFTTVRGLSASGTLTGPVHGTPMDFSGANVALALWTSDLRSDGGSMQSGWSVTLIDTSNRTAVLTIATAPVDIPINKPNVWRVWELPARIGPDNPVSTSGEGRFGGPTAFNFAAVKQVKMAATFRATNKAGDKFPAVFALAGIARVERPARPALTVYLDRFTDEVAEYGFPVFEQFGVKAQFRGDCNTFDSPPSDGMTVTQANDLEAHGHEFGIYGWRPAGVPFITGQNNYGGDPANAYPVPWSLRSKDLALSDWENERDAMIRHGLVAGIEHFAGQLRKATDDGYDALMARFATTDIPSNKQYPTWSPPLDRRNATFMFGRQMLDPVATTVDGTTGVSTLTMWLDQVAAEKQSGRFLLHRVNPTLTGDDFIITPTELAAFLQAAVDRGIELRSHNDLIAGRV